MAKQWQKREDEFLFAYYDTIGDYVGVHDLGRPKGAATKRVKFLRESGAWDALRREHDAKADYLRSVGKKYPWLYEADE